MLFIGARHIADRPFRSGAAIPCVLLPERRLPISLDPRRLVVTPSARLILLSLLLAAVGSVSSKAFQEERPETTRGKASPQQLSPSPDISSVSGEFVKRTPTPPGPWLDPEYGRGIDWKGVLLQSGLFLGIEHGFRFATEQGTRDGMSGHWFQGWMHAAENLHGWADGDEFMVNYVGHPMQGAVTGFIWVHNDRNYRMHEFGMDRFYWKSRLRAMAWEYLYSVQFEIGPVSEASMGKIQASFPQQGFVDHVITPVVGTGWIITEDALDKYVIKRFEERVHNPYLRVLVRGGLNPSRSFANAMALRVPWARDTRPGVFSPRLDSYLAQQRAGLINLPRPPKPDREGEYGIAPFEMSFGFRPQYYLGGLGACVGGYAETGFRVSASWQMVLAVDGCKIMNLERNLTGDSLRYTIGPRWTPRPSQRWSPYVEFLAGGTKVAEERMYPELKASLIEAAQAQGKDLPLHDQYTTQYDWNRFTMSAGAGVDMRFNRALALRIASLDYRHTFSPPINGNKFNNGISFTTGLVVRMGNW